MSGLSNPSRLSRRTDQYSRANGLKAERVRVILFECFQQFHGIDLSQSKLNQLEERIYAGGSYVISPRHAAKAILEIMDESFAENDFFSRPTEESRTFTMESQSKKEVYLERERSRA